MRLTVIMIIIIIMYVKLTLLTHLLIWWYSYDSLYASLAPREVAHIVHLSLQSIIHHHRHNHRHHHLHHHHELT